MSEKRSPRRIRARQKGVKGYISAMRPFWLQNPYPAGEYGRESLQLFEVYLRSKLNSDQDFSQKFDRTLENRDIGCTCPLDQPCHADIIIKIWEERNDL